MMITTVKQIKFSIIIMNYSQNSDKFGLHFNSFVLGGFFGEWFRF